MIVYEPMLVKDILSFDLTNLDRKSENYSFNYYMHYFINHPFDFYTARSFFYDSTVSSSMIYTNPILGYVMGKVEIKDKPCLHLSGLSVCPAIRKYKIGSNLMKMFEMNGNNYKVWFVDFFVRKSNKTAISFYKKLGYVVHRTIFSYYISPREDAYDMRKSLAIDVNKECEHIGKDVDTHALEC